MRHGFVGPLCALVLAGCASHPTLQEAPGAEPVDGRSPDTARAEGDHGGCVPSEGGDCGVQPQGEDLEGCVPSEIDDCGIVPFAVAED